MNTTINKISLYCPYCDSIINHTICVRCNEYKLLTITEAQDAGFLSNMSEDDLNDLRIERTNAYNAATTAFDRDAIYADRLAISREFHARRIANYARFYRKTN